MNYSNKNPCCVSSVLRMLSLNVIFLCKISPSFSFLSHFRPYSILPFKTDNFNEHIYNVHSYVVMFVRGFFSSYMNETMAWLWLTRLRWQSTKCAMCVCQHPSKRTAGSLQYVWENSVLSCEAMVILSFLCGIIFLNSVRKCIVFAMHKSDFV